ncbi:hypothetical protein U9M48_043586 [Paspalum notatum var. saurae]|uniref:F-box domain-containing protein n=1 Tax=Paspalum notatum var. saurae TaxID=547442 RepID=A0AAQ3UV82_PASNO
MEEIVTEILVRLPVKSLLRFRSVSQAWRATISDPIFIQVHLCHSVARWEHELSFIISPHTLNYVIEEERWPTTFSNHIRFYQWQWQWQQGASNKQVATFIHGKDFVDECTTSHTVMVWCLLPPTGVSMSSTQPPGIASRCEKVAEIYFGLVDGLAAIVLV